MSNSHSFLSGLCVDYSDQVKAANGAEYLPWASALAMAGRPQQSARSFAGAPACTIFGGAAVAIDMQIPGTSLTQTTWLPVLSQINDPIPVGNPNLDPSVRVVTSRDINDARNRARAKAVAMVCGVGLGLYAGYREPKRFVEELGITPESDLASAKPLTKEKKGSNAAYLGWAAALAAAKITDPEFRWEVIWFSVTTPDGEVLDRPFTNIGKTFAVEVSVTYKGIEHTEFLPIMGVQEVEMRDGRVKKMDNQALLAPSVADWNKAVMRCLTKAIAVRTGYGINVYAKEDDAEVLANPLSYDAKEAAERAKVDGQPIEKKQIDHLSRALTAAKHELSYVGVLLSDKSRTVEVLTQGEYQRVCKIMNLTPMSSESAETTKGETRKGSKAGQELAF